VKNRVKWVVEKERQPLIYFGVNCPVFQHLLSTIHSAGGMDATSTATSAPGIAIDINELRE